MPRFNEWEQATSTVRRSLAWEFLRDCPHIASYYFHIRFRAFKKHVLKPLFNIVDSWDRYEWQGRGSSHNHGLYYIGGAPNPDKELGTAATQDKIDRMAIYWSRSISAMHPNPGRTNIDAEGIDDVSPLSLPFSQMTFTQEELASILTRCYIHRCIASYCLKRHKQTGEEVYRFQAP